MTDEQGDPIEFDILIRPPASGKHPDVKNIEQFRPDPADIEKCRRWLVSKGVTCHPTDFGLACRTSRNGFESLFSTQVNRERPSPGNPMWTCQRDPQPPSEIAGCIEQITISVRPELF